MSFRVQGEDPKQILTLKDGQGDFHFPFDKQCGAAVSDEKMGDRSFIETSGSLFLSPTTRLCALKQA
jgi:hypothetical protein